MNIYLITSKQGFSYDTYDSAIVIAKDAQEAKKIHPNGYNTIPKDSLKDHTWPIYPKDITAKKVGTTTIKTPQVLLASFNAG